MTEIFTVTQELIDNARMCEYIGNGLNAVIDDKRIRLCDLPYNDHGQTPREVHSFTWALAHLLSTSGGPFITSLTLEAAGYIDGPNMHAYLGAIEEACKRAGVEFPTDLPEHVTRLNEHDFLPERDMKQWVLRLDAPLPRVREEVLGPYSGDQAYVMQGKVHEAYPEARTTVQTMTRALIVGDVDEGTFIVV